MLCLVTSSCSLLCWPGLLLIYHLFVILGVCSYMGSGVSRGCAGLLGFAKGSFTLLKVCI